MKRRHMKILPALFGPVLILAACSDADDTSSSISTANTGITTTDPIHGFQDRRMRDFSTGRQIEIKGTLYSPATTVRDFSIGMAALVYGTSMILNEVSDTDLGHEIELRSATSTARQF